MIVARYMQTGAVTVLPDAPVSQARSLMEEHGFGLLFVADVEGTLHGFLTRAGLKDVSDGEISVRRISHAARFAVAPSDTLEKAALIMLSNRLVLLPVVNDGKLIGVLSQSELLRGLASALGVGLEATRLTIQLTTASAAGLYAILDVLREHEAHIVSLVQSGGANGTAEIIVRVQDVADKEKLREDLESVLAIA